MEVIKRGSETEAWEHVGASKVLISLGLGTLTSVYGALPWSEALKGSEVPYPIFDSQESIYATLLKLLDEAILDLDKMPLFCWEVVILLLMEINKNGKH